MGEADLEARMLAQRLEVGRPAEAPGAAVDEDAAVEEERDAEPARFGEHRLDVGVVGIPAGRHHLRADQAERFDRTAQVQRRARVARIDDREAGEPVGMAADQVGEMFVGAPERRRVIEREALAQERREQDGDVDAGVVEAAQDIVGTLGAAAMQVCVDDHRGRSATAIGAGRRSASRARREAAIDGRVGARGRKRLDGQCNQVTLRAALREKESAGADGL
jgi:hypothetical protein